MLEVEPTGHRPRTATGSGRKGNTHGPIFKKRSLGDEIDVH